MFARKFRTDAGELYELFAESDCQHGLQITTGVSVKAAKHWTAGSNAEIMAPLIL